jgi:sortase B
MQSEKENGQYYMWRDVYGERDGYGTPFLDIRCDMEKPSRNLIIYGHNMLNKTMFSALKNYRDPSYWKAHPGILLERGKVTEYYQVAAVLDLDISQESDENLFRFVDPETEEETKEYLSEISQRALYNTQVPMNPEDSYVTLVTCYRFRVGKTGRVMVVGRREYWEE